MVLFAIFFLYAALVFFGVYHHEPWRDEAHTWISAREDSIGQMIESVRYAPIPLLWTVLLVPLARIGLPYVSMTAFHATIACAAIALLLFFSKVPLSTKILFTFSYYMAYEYAVIARVYVVSAFLLFSIATLYLERFIKPIGYAILVFLLFQTNFYSLVPASMLMIIFGIELIVKKKATPKGILALIIMAGGAFFTIATYIPNPHFANQAPPRNPITEFSVVLGNAIVPSFPTIVSTVVQSSLFTKSVTLITGMTLLLFIIMIWKEKSVVFFAIVTLVWLFYTNLFLHQGTLRHHGLLLIYLLFFWWMYETIKHHVTVISSMAGSLFKIFFSSLLLLSIFFTVYIYLQDYKYNFSGATDMAMYIKSRHLDKYTIILLHASDGEAILPYFPNKTFWYPQFQSFARFHTNDQRFHLVPQISIWDALAKVKMQFPQDQPIFLLLSEQIPSSESTYTLLHQSLTKFFWSNATENFWLYARSRDNSL